MYFKQLLDERCGCASYIIASRQTLDAAIVDPALSIEPYEEVLRERGFRLRYAIDTHVHADHVSGARRLRDRIGAEVCLHASAAVKYPFRPLHDGDELPVGQLRLKVVHTPGHRAELISLLVINPPRSPEPSMVLTGDSLLVGDVGRPDFGGGDAHAQQRSIARLLNLPDWVAVFPGHFEGPCGKGMCGRPSTTIGFERRFNPLAQLAPAAFVTNLESGVPPRPLNMTAIEATNRGAMDCPEAMLVTAPPIQTVGPEAIEAAAPAHLLVDVREPSEFARAHIRGAINVPQGDLLLRIGELPREGRIVVMCQSAQRSLRAAQFLKQTGFTDVVHLAGGITAWKQSGRPVIQGEAAGAAPIIESAWAHAGSKTSREDPVGTSR